MAANRVTARLGYTANLGDFNSLRVDVGVDSDVGPDESTPKAMNRCMEYLESELKRRVEQYVKDLG